MRDMRGILRARATLEYAGVRFNPFAEVTLNTSSVAMVGGIAALWDHLREQ